MRGTRQTASAPAPSVARETVELRIDSLAAGGDGVARAPDGRAVFVPGTAPGDRVRVRLV
ncbi:MAG TPA: TRAM domain-containing protein, partial [Myxococcota bacterium]|nr:TRAM domain-containing protein [Myxococcota bacterium]